MSCVHSGPAELVWPTDQGAEAETREKVRARHDERHHRQLWIARDAAAAAGPPADRLVLERVGDPQSGSIDSVGGQPPTTVGVGGGRTAAGRRRLAERPLRRGREPIAGMHDGAWRADVAPASNGLWMDGPTQLCRDLQPLAFRLEHLQMSA